MKKCTTLCERYSSSNPSQPNLHPLCPCNQETSSGWPTQDVGPAAVHRPRSLLARLAESHRDSRMLCEAHRIVGLPIAAANGVVTGRTSFGNHTTVPNFSVPPTYSFELRTVTAIAVHATTQSVVVAKLSVPTRFAELATTGLARTLTGAFTCNRNA